jgi:galacturan 1,4-alpha-galacturonidase
MGSIGQYSGEKSIIRDVLIENVWMLNGQHGARLKTWAGPNVGYGEIDNVTFRGIWNGGNEQSVMLDSCYFNVSPPPPPLITLLLGQGRKRNTTCTMDLVMS